MYDIVIPNKNEKEFIKIAQLLGYKGLFFLYSSDSFEEYKHKAPIEIYSGIICRTEDEIRKARKKANIIVFQGQGRDLKYMLEKNAPDIITETELHTNKDFIHHRNSGLNHVLADMMSRNNTAYGISFAMLIHNLELTLARLQQNILLHKKSKTKLVIASFARTPYEMRSWRDMAAFLGQLRLHPSVIKQGFNTALTLYKLNEKKKSKEYVRDGVEIVE